MSIFFRQAPESHFVGSPAYLDSIQQTYQKDRISGLIEIQTGVDHQVVLLFDSGTRVRAYRLAAQTCIPLTPEGITADWETRDAPIRTATLSGTAVWAVWLALEFHPPASRDVWEGRQLSNFLADCKAEGRCGVLQFNAVEGDGFMVLWDGDPVRSDTVFASTGGIAGTLPITRLLQENSTAPWEVSYYAARPETLAYQRLLLRTGVSNWSRGAFQQYQELVGQRMLLNLIGNINATSQSQQWNIRLDMNGLVDHHIFLKTDTYHLAYQALLRTAVQQIGVVVGGLLSQRVLGDAFAQLPENQRLLLEDHSITPAAIAR